MAKHHSFDTLIVWIRRELRVQDHLTLWSAVQDAVQVAPTFIFDETFTRSSPARQKVVLEGLSALRVSLRKLGGELFIRHGEPNVVLHRLARETSAGGVYLTKEYHPDLQLRDRNIQSSFESIGKVWMACKDHVLFEEQEILTKSRSTPFIVFTPYKRAWREMEGTITPVLPRVTRVASPKIASGDFPVFPLKQSDKRLSVKGGETNGLRALDNFLDQALSVYHERRDHPGLEGTSRLSHHLSTGTISIRTVYHHLRERSARLRGLRKHGADTFLNELIWREFYYQILANFPHVLRGSFKSHYDELPWSSNTTHFESWCNGATGYPIVDASLRQLNSEGWMHNRGRMIVANFLTKDLHIDWRKGERYFMEHLADGDVALNNGGWQWCAETGNDAQPWFRIFNPVLQSKMFDSDGIFIKHYIPELRGVPPKRIHAPWLMTRAEQEQCGCIIGRHYPAPIVEHEAERKRTLQLYGNITKTN